MIVMMIQEYFANNFYKTIKEVFLERDPRKISFRKWSIEFCFHLCLIRLFVLLYFVQHNKNNIYEDDDNYYHH